ncbi:hypothetical protein ACIGCK_03235 [Microbacterium sp. NPDC078428]|uniref:hypothetical protein n=1 Tax=Microbacterium sp. NPDC078428 TaxID=3364190 RepID=UPI0037C77DB2
MTDSPRIWCFSRRGGVICSRPPGHAGLHNRRGTGAMWADRDADPPRCAGSRIPAEPAPALPGGFPGGRALCPVCTGFVALTRDARLATHDAFRGAETGAEASARAAWFNTHGW